MMSGDLFIMAGSDHTKYHMVIRELPQLGVAEVLASCFIVKCFPEGESYINSTKASSLPEQIRNNLFIYFSMPIHLYPNCDSGYRLLGDGVKELKSSGGFLWQNL